MLEEKVASTLTEICREKGVCNGEALLEIDTAKKAVELYHPEKKWKGLVVQWQDGRVTTCWKNSNDKAIQCCYTTPKPEEDFFYMVQAFYTEPSEKFGYRVRELHSEPSGIKERVGGLIPPPPS